MSQDFFQVLRLFLENGNNWDIMETDIKGIDVIKIPSTKLRPAKLMVRLTPHDENGKQLKAKGLIVDLKIYYQFKKLMSYNIDHLLNFLDEINPKFKKPSKMVIELKEMEKMKDTNKRFKDSEKPKLPESEPEMEDQHEEFQDEKIK